MNKNNPFVKFAHFYILNVKGIKDNAEEIWDDLVDEILPPVIDIFCAVLTIIVRIIFCVLPVKPIYGIFIGEYVDIPPDNGKVNPRLESGYYTKEDAQKIKETLAGGGGRRNEH